MSTNEMSLKILNYRNAVEFNIFISQMSKDSHLIVGIPTAYASEFEAKLNTQYCLNTYSVSDSLTNYKFVSGYDILLR